MLYSPLFQANIATFSLFLNSWQFKITFAFHVVSKYSSHKLLLHERDRIQRREDLTFKHPGLTYIPNLRGYGCLTSYCHLTVPATQIATTGAERAGAL